MQTPSTKVTTAALAGAVVAVLLWAAQRFAGIEVPAEAEQSLVVVVGFVLAYLVPERRPPESAMEAVREQLAREAEQFRGER